MTRCCIFALVVWLFVPGCAKDDPGELVRTAFARPSAPQSDVRRMTPEDQATLPLYDTARVDIMNMDEARQQQAADDAERVRVTHVSDVVSEAVTLTPEKSALPSTVQAQLPAPTTIPGRSTGSFMQLGAVVTSVNGEPIYADDVLDSLAKLFAAEAKTRDEYAFGVFARREIEKQVNVFIATELEVAAARKSLDDKEEMLARDLTTMWRLREISLAGGSLEQARAKAAADGLDFDKMVEDRNREILVQLYYQKKIFPRVQVTAEDIRRYYNTKAKTEFTEQDQAQFRVIRIDGVKTGSTEKALDKINNLRQRALSGEDFGKLAASVNDDAALMRAGGDVGSVQRGAFALEPVEEAVWLLQPGQITEAVKIGDSFYIAKLEVRKDGRVRQFEDEDVQRQIEKKLRAEQIDARRQQQRRLLLQDAVIFPDPPDLSPIVAMAMQKYSQWASAAPVRN
jgi:hypothetical protein